MYFIKKVKIFLLSSNITKIISLHLQLQQYLIFLTDFNFIPLISINFMPLFFVFFQIIFVFAFSSRITIVSFLLNYFQLLKNYGPMICALLMSYHFYLLLFYSFFYIIRENVMRLFQLKLKDLFEPSSYNLLSMSFMLIFSLLFN